MIPAGFVRLLSQADILSGAKAVADRLRPQIKPGATTFVAVLDGALFFLTDLIQELAMDVKVDFLRVSSYDGGETSGDLKLVSGLMSNVAGADVLLVDDILDSGKTLAFCTDYLKSRGAASVRGVVLLAKERPRLAAIEEPAVGFHIPDRFVIGYGLDWQGRYRHLREIFIKDAEKETPR